MSDKPPQRRRTQSEKDATTQALLGGAEAMSDSAVEALLKPDVFTQQARKRIKLFRDAKGKEPTGLKQLKNWEASPAGLATAASDRDNDR